MQWLFIQKKKKNTFNFKEEESFHFDTAPNIKPSGFFFSLLNQ